MLNLNKLQLTNSPQFILFKKNVVYLLAILVFIAIGILFLPKQILEYTSLRQQKSELDLEIAAQVNRLRLIESINVQDMNQLLLILNTLYPQEEDQFSIYPVIDNLEIVTGMLFTKKSSPFTGDPKAKVSIAIDAIGTLDQVKTLLTDYPYKAARILTLENITLTQTKNNPELWNVSFTVQFHTKEVTAGTQSIDAINPMAIAFARQAGQFFTARGAKYTNVSIKDEDIPINYTVKQNPFNN